MRPSHLFCVMPPSSDHRPRVRVVTLPSGRTVRVVHVTAVSRPVPGLHVCPSCTGELVYPTGWYEAGPEHWEVSRRCPSCEWRGIAVHSQAAVERFDEQLDQGADAVLLDLRRMVRSNMEEEIGRFSVELCAGRINADHFRLPSPQE